MKSYKWVWILSGLVVVISLAASLVAMFYGPDRLQLSGKSLNELLNSGVLTGILGVVISLIVVAVVMISFYRTLNPLEVKNGISAQAEVIEVWDTGVTVNNDPQIRLRLRVRKNDGSTFETDVKTLVSRLNAAVVRPGCKAEVKYDPNNLKRIQLVNLELANTVQPAEEIAARLQNLDMLREQGLISAEEYQKARSEILKEI